MFESVRNYLDSHNLRYRYGDKLYEIEWEDDGSCSAFCRGWSIKLNPELAETEELAGEEWVDVQYQFKGIDDDALFGKMWIEAREVLTDYKYDDVFVEDKFMNRILEGTPIFSLGECLSYDDTAADVALNNTFTTLVQAIREVMSRYEKAYFGYDPEREGGQYSEKAFEAFLERLNRNKYGLV